MPDTAAPLISIPLPTITGREVWLEQAIKAYEAHANVEILLYKNLPTCGLGWQKGAAAATGDYIHFGADDVEMHPGWWQAAVEVIDRGLLPAPRVLNTDGTLQSCGDLGEMADGAIPEFTRGPFMSRAQYELLGPSLPIHYFTDNWFTHRGRLHGIETVVCRGYEYTHHSADPGRGAGTDWNDRMRHDHMLYQQYVAGNLRPDGLAPGRTPDPAALV